MRSLLATIFALAALAAALPAAFAQSPPPPPDQSDQRGCEHERHEATTS